LTDVNLLLASIANDFPDIAKTYSIGQSFEGRDINVIEISGNGKNSSVSEPSVKVEAPNKSEAKATKGKSLAQEAYDEEATTNTDELVQLGETGESQESKPEILMTGATHARELISTSLNVYEMLKLLKHGAVEKDPHFEKLLN
jgi:tRNA/tmRNA/rRNA uracil-C5-methylase (TrmA/RlmC/RlmD family)